MTPAQHQELLDLYRTARNAALDHEPNTGAGWDRAHAADRSFTDALAAAVTP